MGRHNLKHPLLSVSLAGHCIASPTLNFASQLRRPLDSLPPALLIMAGRQRRPAPAHAPCSPERERETDKKQRNTLHNQVSHTRVSPQIVSPEHQNTTQQTNYTGIFFNTRPTQHTRTLNAHRKSQITRHVGKCLLPKSTSGSR